jgi:hypothetical protein
MRIFHAVAHTCPGGQVDYGIKLAFPIKEFFQAFLILDVKFVEVKLFSMFMSLELTKSPILESNIIILVEVVDSNYSIPMVEQFPTDLGGDETSDSSHQKVFNHA